MPGSWQPKTRCLPLLTLPALPLPTLPSPCCSQREWNRNRRSPSPPPLEGVRDLREMLSRRVSGRASDAAAAPAGAAPAGPAAAGMVPPGMGLPAERRVHERVHERERGPARQAEDRVLTLDELFKKTAAKPCIYWLPLTGGCVQAQGWWGGGEDPGGWLLRGRQAVCPARVRLTEQLFSMSPCAACCRCPGG